MSEFVDFEGKEASPELARRLRWAFAYIRARGGTITANEIRRVVGSPKDRAIGAAGKPASATSTGGSNQYYQLGRQDLWVKTGGKEGTPSAAQPGEGDHPAGNAADTDTDRPDLRRAAYALAGIDFTVPREEWHGAVRGTPRINVDDLASAGLPNTATPTRKKLDMTLVNVHDDNNKGGGNPAKIWVEAGKPDLVMADDIEAAQFAKISGQDLGNLPDYERSQYDGVKARRGA
jgi:hypothetical protein